MLAAAYYRHPASTDKHLRRRRTISARRHDNNLTYRDAGVDIDAGNSLVEAIKPLAAATARAGADAALGGFGGLFDLKAAGFQDPVLVAATDGIGTKLKVAVEAQRYDTVGVDLVAMCVNDLVVQGAEPLFFLDYLSMGKLSLETGRALVSGIARGCTEAGCALIGGETAEMPGLYQEGDFDAAGFAVGAVERSGVLDGGAIADGDVILGLTSSGLHSNGYSLARRVLSLEGLGVADHAPFDPARTLGEALLEPTRIYVKPCLRAVKAGGVHGLAHITGGGLFENVARILPGPGLSATIDRNAWPRPAVFDWLSGTGGIEEAEMMRVFNCGIGMVAVVAADRAEALSDLLLDHGESVFTIGRIAERTSGMRAVEIAGLK